MGAPKKTYNQYTKPKPTGANTRALKNALEGFKHPRVDTKDIEAITARITEYLQYCMDNDVSPGIAACANWLGINVKTLESWYTGVKGSPDHQRVASRFYGVVQDVWQSDMHEGNVNPVAGIFVSKVFYGYKDTQEIVIHHEESHEPSAADLIAESKRLQGANGLALTDGKTIDADYSVIEDDPKYEKAKARKERMDAQKAKPVKNRKYMQKYYQEHKEEYKARKIKAAEKKRAERAQKEAQNGAEKAQKEV